MMHHTMPVRRATTLLGLTLSLGLGACVSPMAMKASAGTEEPSAMTTESAATSMESSGMMKQSTAAMPRSVTIDLTPGTVIEVAYASIKQGKQQELFGEYFPRVTPIVAEYGGKSLGMFQVRRTLAGKNQPQIIGLFQWPSVEAFLALHQDPRFLKIRPIRDGAFAQFDNGNFYVVDQPTSITFDEGHAYDIWGGWLQPEGRATVERLAGKADTDARLNHRTAVVSMRALALSPAIAKKVASACGDDHQNEASFADLLTIIDWTADRPDGSASTSVELLHRQRDGLASRFERFQVGFAFPPKKRG